MKGFVPKPGWCAVTAMLLGFGAAAPSRADVLLSERQVRYRLEAHTPNGVSRELADYLRTDGARGAHGLTRSSIQLRYELMPDTTRGCRLRELRVELDLSVTLPSWQPRMRANSRDRMAIEAMLAGLARHEAGHRRNAIETARTIERGLRALGTSADCRAATRAVNRVFRRQTVRFAARDLRYDQVTDHGRRQGARLESVSTSTAR
jgi:predicted secreted Zn-dependent protease